MMNLDYYTEIINYRNIKDIQILDEFLTAAKKKSQYEDFEYDKMENFFFKSIETNTCTTIDDNPSYHKTVFFNATECATANKGMLTHGLSIAMTDFVTGFT